MINFTYSFDEFGNDHIFVAFVVESSENEVEDRIYGSVPMVPLICSYAVYLFLSFFIIKHIQNIFLFLPYLVYIVLLKFLNFDSYR